MATRVRTRSSRSASPPKRRSRLMDADRVPFKRKSDDQQEILIASSNIPSTVLSSLAFSGDQNSSHFSSKPTTLKEYDKHIAELEKENFNLKLRLYLLEEKLSKRFQTEINDFDKDDIYFQSDMRTLQKELEHKNKLLQEALRTLEKMERSHKQELINEKDKARSEQTSLENKITLLKQEKSCIYQLKDELLPNFTLDKLKQAFHEKIQELKETKKALDAEKQNVAKTEDQANKLKNLLETSERENERLKELLNARSVAVESIDAAVHTAFFKGIVAARLGDKEKLAKVREELKLTLKKALLDEESVKNLADSSLFTKEDDILEELHHKMNELQNSENIIQDLQEQAVKKSEKMQDLQQTLENYQNKLTHVTELYNTACAEKDDMISQLQHCLRDAELKMEELFNERNKLAAEDERRIEELVATLQSKEKKIQKLQQELNSNTEMLNGISTIQEKMVKYKKDRTLKNKLIRCSSSSTEPNSLDNQVMKKKKLWSMENLMDIETPYNLSCSSINLEGKNKKSTISKLGLDNAFSFTNLLKSCIPSSSCPNLQFITPLHNKIHFQNLLDLQQQLNESHNVCELLQQQLAEVTEFVDHLIHLDGAKHNAYISEERCAPEGNSITSELNVQTCIEKQDHDERKYNSFNLNEDQEKRMNDSIECQDNDFFLSSEHSDVNANQTLERISTENLYNQALAYVQNDSFYKSDVHKLNNNGIYRESELDIKQKEVSDDLWSSPEQLIVLEASDSDDILLLLNDKGFPEDVYLCQDKMQPWSLNSNQKKQNICHNDSLYVDTNNDLNSDKCNLVANCGSVSDSLIMAYNNSLVEIDKDLNIWNTSCTPKNIYPGTTPPMLCASYWSSDSDVWSEPDREVSHQRLEGYCSTWQQSDESEYISFPSNKRYTKRKCMLSERKRKSCPEKYPVPTSAANYHLESAPKSNKWQHKLKNYLHSLEQLNSQLHLEINSQYDLNGQIMTHLALLCSASKQDCSTKNDSLNKAIKEHIRSLSELQKKLDKTVHHNKQLQDLLKRKYSGHEQDRYSNYRKKTKSRKRNGQINNLCNIPLSSEESYNQRRVADAKSQELNFPENYDLISRNNELKTEESKNYNSALNLKEVFYNHEGIEELKDEILEEKLRAFSDDSQIISRLAPPRRFHDYNLRVVKDLHEKEWIIQTLASRLQESEEKLMNLNAELWESDRQLKQVTEKNLELQLEINKRVQDLMKLEMDNLNVKHKYEEYKKQLIESQNQVFQLQSELHLYSQKLQDAENSYQVLKIEHIETQKSKLELLKANDVLKQRIDSQESAFIEIEDKRQLVENKIKIIEENWRKVIEDNSNLRRKIYDLELCVRWRKKHIDHLNCDMNHSGNKENVTDSSSLKRPPHTRKTKKQRPQSLILKNYVEEPYPDAPKNHLLREVLCVIQDLHSELKRSFWTSSHSSNYNHCISCCGKSEEELVSSHKTLNSCHCSKVTSKYSCSVLSSDSLSLLPLAYSTPQSSSGCADVSSQYWQSNGSSSSLNLSTCSSNKINSTSNSTRISVQLLSSDSDSVSYLNRSRSLLFNSKSPSLENCERIKFLKESTSIGETFSQDFESSDIKSSFDSVYHTLEGTHSKDSKFLKSSIEKLSSWQCDKSNVQKLEGDHSGEQKSPLIPLISPLSRAQFSPDLGIESDPNGDSCFSTLESQHKVVKRCCITDKAQLLETIKTMNCSTAKSEPVLSPENNPSFLHAVTAIQDYELLKMLVGECLINVKGMASRINHFLGKEGDSASKNLESFTLKEVGYSCQNIELFMEKGWHLMNNFVLMSLSSGSQHMAMLVRKNNLLFEELSLAKNKVETQTNDIHDLMNKLEVAITDKQNLQKTLVRHLNKTFDALKPPIGTAVKSKMQASL